MLFVFLFGADFSAGQGLGKVIASDGVWELRQSKDNFTDKITCLIAATNNDNVEVSPGNFYLSLRGRGGLKAYKYRLDDSPPTELALPTELEQRTSILIFKGQVFSRILKANRLRVQTLTMLSGSQNDDIDLTGLAGLYSQMSKACPKK